MKRTKDTSNQILEGAIWKQLLLFFFPILLGTFFQQFYNTIDMIIVGRFVGTQALASVGGSAGQIINLVVGFFTGLSAGAGVIISQQYGAGNQKMLNDGIHTAYALCIVGGIVFTVLGVVLSPQILYLMKTPEDVLQSSTLYLRIYFFGILFVFIYNIGSGILRALGDSKRPLYFLIICCVLNVILDLIMVVIFRMGVAGVALATLIAQAVSAVLVTLSLMKSDDIYRLELRKISFNGWLLKSQLFLGIPGGIQSVMYSLSNVIIQTAINSYGISATAAWAAESKIDALFWMINGAFGVSITTFVGQNFGAGKKDRIKKGIRVCLFMHQAVSLLITCILIGFRGTLFGIFTSDAEVVRIGSEMLMGIAPFFLVFSFIEIYSSSLRAMGDVVKPMFITMFGVCLLRVFWTLVIVPLRPSILMIVMNYPVTWCVTAVLFLIYFGKMKKKLLRE